MNTIGGEMAGLKFAVRVPDEERRRQILEIFDTLSPQSGDGDCVCKIEDPEGRKMEKPVRRGYPRLGYGKMGEKVEIWLEEEKLMMGEIDGDRQRGTYYDVSPKNFLTLFSLFFRAFVQVCLLKFDGLLVHGCGIVKEGKGYLFMGPSETGKTTIAGNCGPKEVLSDEAVCVYRREGRWRIHSTFWRCWNMGSAELSRIFVLHRDEKRPAAWRVRGAEAMAWLSQNPFTTPDSFGHSGKLLELLSGLANDVPCIRMRIDPENAVWSDIENLLKTM